MKKVELLAPAGSPEAFYGAVSAGADAVYLGGKKFGARAYAENFTEEELEACIRYGRLFGVKVYLAVNTLLKEQELDELPEYLAPFCDAGLAGVIVQDLGVLARIREAFPALPLHASTQMTLCSSYGAEFLKGMGIRRIVPARELSLKELTVLKRRTGLELETFVHGAMCYCYSGQCLFSSILGGRSGNRGRCAQPCRLPYTVTNGRKQEQCYPLSLKDLCAVEHIPALIEAGIDSFKIEGRMKKPEYAAGVTAVYRKYIDRYYDLREQFDPEQAQEAFQVDQKDRENLSSLYVRGKLQDGYYFRRNGREMVTLDSPAYSGASEELLKQIRQEHLRERPRLAVEAEAEFLSGLPAKVLLRRGDVAVEAVGEPVQVAQRQPVTKEDILRQLNRLGESPFAASSVQVQVGENVFYPLKQINELRRQAVSMLEKALLEKEPTDQSGPTEADRLQESFVNSCVSSTLRAAGNLRAAGKSLSLKEGNGLAVSLRTLEQLKALAEILPLQPFDQDTQGERQPFFLRRLYVDGDLLLLSPEECMVLIGRINNTSQNVASSDKPEILVSLPYILREADMAFLEKLWGLVSQDERLDGFLVRSLDGLGFLLERERRNAGHKLVRTDAGVYIWNSETAYRLACFADGFCLPYELKTAQQRKLLERASIQHSRVSWEKIIYGRIPMMVTANCVQKTHERCSRDGEGILWLRDRCNADFPVLRNCTHCVNIIYNSVPLALFGEQNRLRGVDTLRLDFTIETGEELTRVMRTYLAGDRLAQGTYTTGHEKRGVQ